MLDQDIGLLCGKNITYNTTADAGNDAQKEQQKAIVMISTFCFMAVRAPEEAKAIVHLRQETARWPSIPCAFAHTVYYKPDRSGKQDAAVKRCM